MTSPAFATSEEGGPQLQALHTLGNLGWRYLTRAESEAQRRGRLSTTILEDVARDALVRLNAIHQRGHDFPVPDAAIGEAIGRLRAAAADHSGGYLEACRNATNLLLLGTSVDVTVEGETRGRQLRFIDWQVPENNRFHVTSEFVVDRMDGGGTRRPDIVLHVNGMPLAVIEVKRSTEATDQGISQSLRNQDQAQIPQLFATAQVLLAANPSDPRYATSGTPAEFWSVWREDPDAADALSSSRIADAVNRPMDPRDEEAVFTDFSVHRRRHEGLMEAGSRFATALDETLVSLFTPARLIELSRAFTLFDDGVKKVARYQQFFAVKETLRRIGERDGEKRRGGVVWHTQGSGKSLTMVMLAQEIARAVVEPLIVLVTDRTDLDDQIRDTFKATLGEDAVTQANTGRELLKLAHEKSGHVVTTLVHKFKSGLAAREWKNFQNTSADVFLLVDESHRSQNVKDTDSLHARMRRVFPHAAYVGFTGTPLLRREKSTFDRFGALIHSYKIDEAVRDGAVVPLTYEGRHVDMEVDEKALDKWFERVTKALTEKQVADLKRRFSQGRAVRGAEPWLKEVAFDVSEDFDRNWKGSPYKAQLVAPDKRSAVVLKRLLDEFGKVTSEVVISDVDEREGHDAVNREPAEEVVRYLKEVKANHGSVKEHERSAIERFKKGGAPDILIVVDKLLTGFDAPRNRVLYLAKPMKEHGLLQAIARVNRLYQDGETKEKKEFGHVIDYAGVLSELDQALTAYGAFEGYDEGDVREALVSIRTETEKLDDRHAALLDLFKSVDNQGDQEAYERLLEEEPDRREFYKSLRAFASTLATAFSSEEFVRARSTRELENYKADLKRFENLRRSVARRYGDVMPGDELRAYEAKVRRLLDKHIDATDMQQLVAPVDIFDEDTFKSVVEDETGSAASIADTIASATSRTITERMDEDPVLYKRFAAMIAEAIARFRVSRDAETFLATVKSIHAQVASQRTDDLPDAVRGKPLESAFYRSVGEAITDLSDVDAQVRLAIGLAAIARQHERVGWQNDRDVENAIRNDMEDYLHEAEDWLGVELSFDAIDQVMDRTIDVARRQLAA